METSKPKSISLRLAAFIILITYALLAALVIPLAELTNYLTLTWAFPVAMSVFCMAGNWSVLGVSTYLKRTGIALSIVLILAAALIGGYIYSTEFLQVGIYFGDSHSFALKLALYFAIVFSIVSQLPFWIAKGSFGWHYAHPDYDSVEKISLRTMFTIVAVFAAVALCFNLTMQTWIVEALKDVFVGGVTLGTEVGPDGFVSTVGITKENIEAARATTIRSGYEFGRTLATFAAVCSIYSLFTLPLVWSVFRSTSFLKSLVSFVGIGVMIFTIGMAIGSATSGISNFLANEAWTQLYTICIALGSVWVPLILLKRAGIRLETGKRPAPVFDLP